MKRRAAVASGALLLFGCATEPSPPAPAASAASSAPAAPESTPPAASGANGAPAAPGPAPSGAAGAATAPPPPQPIRCKVTDTGGDTASGADLQNESVCKNIAAKANAGTATMNELRMLKAACSALGDKECRDAAAAAIARMKEPPR